MFFCCCCLCSCANCVDDDVGVPFPSWPAPPKTGRLFLVVVICLQAVSHQAGRMAYNIFVRKTFVASACLGCGFTFFVLKPARDEFKFKMKRVTDDVDFQLKYDAKEYGRISIDYSTEEAKELARKEFMGDPFAKVKLKSEFTNTINLFKQKLLG